MVVVQVIFTLEDVSKRAISFSFFDIIVSYERQWQVSSY